MLRVCEPWLAHTIVGVLFDHSFGAETGGIRSKTFLHELQPAAGDPVKVSLIVEGNGFLLQYAVELLRVMLILGLNVLVSD